MWPIVFYFGVSFAIAAFIGLKWCDLKAWNYSDAIYYPLAAVGVMLLFANGETQRELLEATRVVDERRADLQSLVASRPDTRLVTNEELLEARLGMIFTISQWRSICETLVTPRCSAIEGLLDPVDKFVDAAKATYPSPELRLSAVCSAADTMLQDVAKTGAISSIVWGELVLQYKTAAEKKLDPLDHSAIEREIQAFEQRAVAQVNEIHRLAFKVEDDGSRRLYEIRRAEVEFSTWILWGLASCITSPRSELDTLAKWTESKRTTESEVQDAMGQRDRLRDAPTRDPSLLRVQLTQWPFVLLTALALKFGKGIATIKKAQAPAGRLASAPSFGVVEADPPTASEVASTRVEITRLSEEEAVCAEQADAPLSGKEIACPRNQQIQDRKDNDV